MTCDTCGSSMKPLFTSWYCPNEGSHRPEFLEPIPCEFSDDIRMWMEYSRKMIAAAFGIPKHLLDG